MQVKSRFKINNWSCSCNSTHVMKQQHTFGCHLLLDKVPYKYLTQLASLNSNDMLPLYLSSAATQNETKCVSFDFNLLSFLGSFYGIGQRENKKNAHTASLGFRSFSKWNRHIFICLGFTTCLIWRHFTWLNYVCVMCKTNLVRILQNFSLNWIMGFLEVHN